MSLRKWLGGMVRLQGKRRGEPRRGIARRRPSWRLWIEGLETRQCPTLTLTPAGVAAGFSLSTFASGFPTVGAIGPLGIAFPKSGGVLVSDFNGQVRSFADSDGQNAATAPVTYDFGIVTAPTGMIRADGNIYLALQGGLIVQLNDGGTPNQQIVAVPHPTGMVANSANSHFFVDGAGTPEILDVDPIAKTATYFNMTANCDGLAISPDGAELYGNCDGGVEAFATATGQSNFGPLAISGGPDGLALGAGPLTGYIFVNTNDGNLIEVNLNVNPPTQTVIATGGSRGDFVNADPYNGTLLITQTDSILRLSPGHFAYPDRPVVASGGYVVHSVEGAQSGNQGVANFTDPDGPNAASQYSASINWGDGQVSAGTIAGPDGNGVFTVIGNHAYAEEGSYSISVSITHDASVPVTVGSTASVSDPAVAANGGYVDGAVEGTNSGLITLAAFNDPGGSEAVGDYSAVIGWGDGSVSAGTVSFNGTFFLVQGSHTYAEEGSYPVLVVINHDSAPSTSVSSQVNVADPAVTATGGYTVSAVEGISSGAQTVATFTDPGGAEVVSDYGASINWGDGTPSTAGTISVSGGVYTVQGSHTYAAEGSYPITVSISHDSAPSNTASSTATVSDPAVTATGGFTVTAAEGASLGAQTVATFTDPGGAEVVTDYSASINWGDSSSSAGTITQSGGVYTVTGSHTYAEEGSYPITVSISHDSAPTSTASSTATVADSAVTATGGFRVSAVEGASSGAQTVATFTDPGGAEVVGDYSASINWGDSTTSAGTISVSGSTFTVTGSHTYAEEGSYPIITTISHENAPTASATSTATVADAALTDTSATATPSVAEGASTGTLMVATFTDANPGNNSANFTATITWGDSSTSPGTVSFSGGTYSVSGSHTYTDEGSYAVTVNITDDGGSTLTGVGKTTVTVNEADVLSGTPVAIAPTEGTSFSGTVATFTDTYDNAASDLSATITWGDGTPTTAGTVTRTSAGHYSVSGTHAYADEGPVVVTVTLSDNAPGTATKTVSSTNSVADADSFTGTPQAISATEGSSFSGTVATFTDTYDNAASDLLATITWGDGTPAAAGTVTRTSAGHYSVRGTHTYADEGTFTVVVTLRDNPPGTSMGTVSSTATVADNDHLTGMGTSISATEGAALANTTVATFTDTFDNAATDFNATITWGDSTTSTGTVTRTGTGAYSVSGSHTYAEEGTYSIQVTLTDNSPGTASGTATSTATVADPAVVPTGVAVSASEGAAFTAAVATFTDPGGPEAVADYAATIAWGDSTTSTGTISVSGGTFTVTGSHTYAEEGSYAITITLSHDSAPTSMANSTASVFDQAVLVSATNLSAVEGAAFTQTVTTFTDPGGSETVTDYAASIDWGDSSSSAGAITGPDSHGVFTVTGSHAYAEEGSYSIHVSVSHESAATRTVVFSVVVSDPAVAPTGGFTVMAVEGAPSSSQTVATFTDPGGPEAVGNYSATIAWGDNSSSSSTITLSGSVYTVQGSHTYAEEGSYPITVTLAHGSAPNASTTSTATVGDPAVTPTGGFTVTAAEGASSGAQTVATFTDPGSAEVIGDYSASINWGDSTTSAGTISVSGSTFTVTGSHTYAEEGSYPITVTISHDSAPTASTTSSASVSDPAVVLTGKPASASEGAAFTAAVATFTDPGGAEAIGDYSATITWGDSTTSTGTITVSSGVFTVAGSHTYAEEGSYPITVSINHDSAPTSTATSTASVSDPAVAATGSNVAAVEGAAFTKTVATFTDPGSAEVVGDYAASINWGDGSSSSGTISVSNGTFTVQGSHTYAEEGSYAISVSISHDSAPSSTATSTATVADPAVAAPGGFTVTAVEGASSGAQTVATFTDPGGAEAVSDYSASISWGDGSSSAGTISGSGGTFTVQGSHTYAEEGNYPITVTLSHDSAPASTAASNANISDPAVTATGGFSVTAPEGAPSGAQTVATFTDAGGAEALADYSASIKWGDGSASAGTITFSNGVFSVQGGHTYAEEGSYPITVTISHDSAPSSTATSTATVADPAVAAAGGFTVTAVEGASSGAQTVATFTDPGGAEAVSDYSASINWGDGSSSAGTISVSGGTFTVQDSHTYAEEGGYPITVTINHDSAPASTATSTASVADPAVAATGGFTVTAVEGASSGAQTVATFTDPGSAEAVSDYSASINWGDGSSSAGTISVSDGTFTVQGSHTYAEEGSYPITITLSHDSAPTSTATSTANISDPAVTATGGYTVSAAEGASSGAQTVATFTDPGGAEVVANYSASISWGDGSSSAGTITLANGIYIVQGSHTYTEEGSYPITVTINHDTAPASTVRSSASVSDPAVVASAKNFSAVEGAALTNQAVATFTDPGGAEVVSDYTATITWGDGSSSSGTITFNAATGVFTVSGSHTYAEEGLYHTSVRILHDIAPAVTVFGSAQVADAALHATAVSVTAMAGAPFQGAVASFTDSDPAGTVADYTATITWGDGTTSPGTITADGSGGFTVSGSHTYAAAGSYPLSVQITDIGGSQASAGSPVVVSNLGVAVGRGLTATIGFWHNQNGQALISSFNGGPSATALSDWLAATFSNLYGVHAGANNLTGKTNAQVAAYYQTLFDVTGQKLAAQVLDTALSVYATTASLGGNAAVPYGFSVSAVGVGAYSFNVGSSGAAFGVPNNTVLNVYQLLKAANGQAVNGVLYNGNANLADLANALFDALNQTGDIT